MALNGHVDVVPAGEISSWHHDPWGGEVGDSKLWGRGACDMKGGVAAMIQAVKIVRDCGFRLKGDVYVHVVSDEEVVGFGSRQCAERAPRPDFVIVTEPTRLGLYPVEVGLEHFRIEIEGQEEHAGRRYSSIYPREINKGHGVNAVEKGIIIVQALQQLERNWALARGHPLLPAGFNTLLPGIFIGGPGGGKNGQLNIVTNPGTTPNYCSIEYNLWYYPHETLEQYKREIEGCVAAVCEYDPWLKAHPPTSPGACAISPSPHEYGSGPRSGPDSIGVTPAPRMYPADLRLHGGGRSCLVCGERYPRSHLRPRRFGLGP